MDPYSGSRMGSVSMFNNFGIASLLRGRHALLLGVLGVTVAVVAGVNPAFLGIQNLRDLLVQAAPIVIVACGMTFVVLTGEIDISVGSLLGVLGALMGVLASPSHAGMTLPVVIGVTLLAGTGIGLVNGLLVTVGRVPSVIATLGTMTILRGVTEWAMGGNWITDLPSSLRVLGIGGVLGVPVSVGAAAVVAGVSWVVLRRTRAGLCVFAVGGNEDAARLARIRSGRVKTLAFAGLGFLTGVAALVSVPQLSVIESGLGVGFELVAVTAVVVGGTSIRGGSGGIAGTLLAAVLLGSIRTALVFLKLGESATYWERAIQGGFILAAVLADHVAGMRGRSAMSAEAPG